MVQITQVTKIELGATTNDKETLTNVKRVIPSRVPQRHSPQTVMGTINPIGWNKPHKYPIFEIHCSGEVYHAIYHNGSGNVAYDSDTADNPEIPYFKFFLKDYEGQEWTVTLTGAIIDGVLDGISDGQEMITIIYVSARSRTPLTKT